VGRKRIREEVGGELALVHTNKYTKNTSSCGRVEKSF
jgi:hypothetical protein